VLGLTLAAPRFGAIYHHGAKAHVQSDAKQGENGSKCPVSQAFAHIDPVNEVP